MRHALLLAALKLAVLCAPPVFDIVRVPPAAPAPKPVPAPHAPAAKPVASVRRLLLFTVRKCRWCPQAKRGAADWKKNAKPRKGEYVEYELVDGDLYPERVRQFGITAYPTFIVTLNGHEIARHEGSLSTAAGVERFVSQEQEPVRRVSLPSNGKELRWNYRDEAVMRDHLIGTHGFTHEQVDHLGYEALLKLHDEAHGEVLR